MTNNCWIYFTLFLGILIMLFESSSAVCCYNTCGRCLDCSIGAPYCGKQSCNIFGCNCGGGCRKGNLCPLGKVNKKRQVVVGGPTCGVSRNVQAYCTVKYHGAHDWTASLSSACPSRSRRDVDETFTPRPFISKFQQQFQNASELFKLIDLNQNEKIEFQEATDYLNNIGVGLESRTDTIKQLKILDANQDGILQLEEID